MACAICWAGFSSSVLANNADFTHFEWRCRISGTADTDMLHKVLLPVDVISRMRSFPLDARIIDEKKDAWPSMIWSRVEPEIVMPVNKEQADVMMRDVDAGVMVRTFRVTGQPVRHNRVIVALKGSDVLRRCEVWGGEHAGRMKLLGESLLIERTSSSAIRHRIVDYPDSTASMLQVRVFPDQREQALRTTLWQATELAYVSNKLKEPCRFDLEVLDPPADRTDAAGVTSVYLGTGMRPLPLIEMQIEAGGLDGLIPVEVHGRHGDDEPWRKISDGVIAALDDVMFGTVNLRRMDYPRLRLDVLHGGAKPPRVKSVKAFTSPHYLVFRPLAPGKAHVYFGSERYQLPAVSFVRGVDGLAVQSARELELSRRHINPARMIDSLDAYWRTILQLLLFIVVATVLVMSTRVIKMRYFS